MSLSALKTKVPPPWTNAGLAPLVALALIAGARTAQAQEPAVAANGEQPDGADCPPPATDTADAGDPSATSTGAAAGDPSDDDGAGSSECQVPPDDGVNPDGPSAPDGAGGSGGNVVVGGGQGTTPTGDGQSGDDVGGADGPGTPPGGGAPHAPGGGAGRTGGGTAGGYTGGGGAAGPGGPGGTVHHGSGGASNHNGGGETRAGERHPSSTHHSPLQNPNGGTSSNPASTTGLAPVGVPSFTTGQFEIPPYLLPIYQRCGTQYGIPWEVLAGINRIETAFGTNPSVSSAGAMGWMQFLPSSWRVYGVDANADGRKDPYAPADAICSAARYLKAAGGDTDLRRALFAYNHADWYVDEVLLYAAQYERNPDGAVGILGELPDPLPPAQRLDRGFARSLARIARTHEVDWALVLAILRARANGDAISTDLADVRQLARRLERGERHARGLGPLVRLLFPGRHSLDLTVIALARYNEAVGLRGLVDGMNAVKGQLGDRVLQSPRLDIYPGGRDDIATGRVDVRVLAELLYLAESYDSVTVSCLITGHSYLTSSGNPSLHAFGRAVDISAVNGIPITGHQDPGGLTEHVLRHVLALPDELQPSELISLFDLGGPSFALADHYDHIHIGF